MRSRLSIALAVLWVALPSLAGGFPVHKEPANVLVTIEIGRLEGGKPASVNSYQMLAYAGGPPAQMNAGSRIPIPTVSTASGDGSADRIVPVTSYTYQNVGLSAKIRVLFPAGGGIYLEGEVDASMIRVTEGPKTAAAPPVIGTTTQTVNVLLKEGRKQRIALIEEPALGSIYVDIKAELVD